MNWDDVVSNKVKAFRDQQVVDSETTYSVYQDLSRATMTPESGCGVNYVDDVPTFWVGAGELFKFETHEGTIYVKPTDGEEKGFKDKLEALEWMAELRARCYAPQKPRRL